MLTINMCKISSAYGHCGKKGPHFRDWVPIGTFLTFWVPILCSGSLFSLFGVNSHKECQFSLHEYGYEAPNSFAHSAYPDHVIDHLHIEQELLQNLCWSPYSVHSDPFAAKALFKTSACWPHLSIQLSMLFYAFQF